MRRYPLVRYHLFNGNAADVTDRQNKGSLNFALLIGAVKLEQHDYITLPVQARWGVSLPAQNPPATHAVSRAGV